MMTRSFYRLTPTHLSLLRKAVVVSRQLDFKPHPWYFARLFVFLYAEYERRRLIWTRFYIQRMDFILRWQN